MNTDRISPGADALEADVGRARAGDRAALERVVRAAQAQVYGIALRFLWHPEDAEDATQDILIRLITGLAEFRGESAFRTWVCRVACNALLNMKRQRMEERTVSFDEFGEDLERGLVDDADARDAADVPSCAADAASETPARALLLEEVKIGCTLAMLLCLDRPHRVAYILGDILELDHAEGAQVLEITPAAFRKRLSRARAEIVGVMSRHCGLVEPDNRCRCSKKVPNAVALGRVDPRRLLFASSVQQATSFPAVLDEIRRLEHTRRAAALYRSHCHGGDPARFIAWLREVIPPEVACDRRPDPRAA